ncbi:MAG: ATP phosphoribosyltransferase regulatory subunit [Gammaproteobacteria bacterium]|tara:strand:+ start:757 stop:1710 length:954 start_codon:yes stop_codon:yes gene_type:complete
MPSNSSNLPDGVEDLTSFDASELETLKRSLIDFYQSKNFQLTYPSLVEFADAIGGTQNSSLRESAFTFFDDLSSNELAIRPDISQQIARIDQAEESEKEQRYCYVGEVLKKRKDSFSRSRITIKAGVEIFGGGDNKYEVLSLLSDSVKIGNLNELTLSFGKTEILNEVLEPLDLDFDDSVTLNKIISSKSKSDLSAWVKEKKISNEEANKLLTLIDCNGDLSVISKLQNIETSEGHLSEIQDIWDFIEKETCFKPHIDLTDFPGFNYHDGLVFSAHSDRYGFSIANGGNYFSQTSSGKLRSAIGFDQDIIAMIKLKA